MKLEPLSPRAVRFLGRDPNVLGVIGNRTYYEHPDFGDEAPMFYIEDGKLRRSVFFDMESASDA